MGEDIPSPHYITLYLPRSADRESDDLMVMLSNQNEIETDAYTDLTLDTASVEEMDQQPAMSSQELQDELKGAEVTFTPCDDEGNSRPPSSCDMEPLI
ncbi:hypothetical protein ACLKA7_011544 [Drosophila subpalustris]